MEVPIRSRKPRRVWLWTAVALVVVIGGVGATVVARNADGDAKSKEEDEQEGRGDRRARGGRVDQARQHRDVPHHDDHARGAATARRWCRAGRARS